MANGAYVLADSDRPLQLILIATGSEVSTAIHADGGAASNQVVGSSTNSRRRFGRRREANGEPSGSEAKGLQAPKQSLRAQR